MMKKFISNIVALMLSAVVISGAIAAPGDKGFYYGAKNPEHLAQLIEKSLAQDVSGKTMLSAETEKCRKDGSCATPLNYLEALQRVDPGAHLKQVSEVPAYLRTLKVVNTPFGKYRVSCLRPGDSKFNVVMDCLEREFEPGEKAWVDPKTEIAVLTANCANIILRKIPLEIKIIGGEKPCAEIYFFARKGDLVVRHTAMGSPEFKNDCFAIKKVGETVLHILWKDACASVHCTFAANEAHLGKKAWQIASYELEEGEYMVRVPHEFAATNSPYAMAFCIERTAMPWPEIPKGKYTATQVDRYAEERAQWIAGHSDVVYVWWNAYHIDTDGVAKATIYHSEAEVPATETVKMYWRYGVWQKEQR